MRSRLPPARRGIMIGNAAVAAGASSIAFPAISTGVYGYPLDRAAVASLSEVSRFLESCSSSLLVRFVLFSAEAYQVFDQALAGIEPDPGG